MFYSLTAPHSTGASREKSTLCASARGGGRLNQAGERSVGTLPRPTPVGGRAGRPVAFLPCKR